MVRPHGTGGGLCRWVNKTVPERVDPALVDSPQMKHARGLPGDQC